MKFGHFLQLVVINDRLLANLVVIQIPRLLSILGKNWKFNDKFLNIASFVFCKLVLIQGVNVCGILKKKESIFISKSQKIRFSKFMGPRGQGNKLIIKSMRPDLYWHKKVKSQF